MTDTDIIYEILRKTCKVGVEESRMKSAIAQMFLSHKMASECLGSLSSTKRAMLVKNFIDRYRDSHRHENPSVYTTYEEAFTLVLDYKENGWNIHKVDELMEYPNWQELLISKLNEGRK